MGWLIIIGLVGIIAASGLGYTIFVFFPLMLLNLLYNIFQFIGSGFSSQFFHTQIIDGRLIWQFHWQGQLFTIVIGAIIIAAVIWLAIFLIKINRINAMRKFGNGGQIKEHVVKLIGFPVFIFVSPFIMMVGSTLCSLLVGMFNQNVEATLSAKEYQNIINVLIPNLNGTTDLSNVQLNWEGTTFNLINGLNDVKDKLNAVLIDATNHGRSDIVDIVNKQIETINNLLAYVQTDLPNIINNIRDILYKVSAGLVDEKLSQQLGEEINKLQNIFTYFNQFVDYSDSLGRFNIDIVKWSDTHKYLFTAFSEIKNSLNSNVNKLQLGYWTSQTGWIWNLINGYNNNIGLSAITAKLGGYINMNLVQAIYTFITGDPNGNNWVYGFRYWNQVGLGRIICGFIVELGAIGSVLAIVLFIAKGWVWVYGLWIGTLFILANGEDYKLKAHFARILRSWFEIFFCYMYMQVILTLVPVLAQISTTSGALNMVAEGSALVFIDAGLMLVIPLTNKTVNALEIGDAPDYNVNAEGLSRGSNMIKDQGTNAGKSAWKNRESLKKMPKRLKAERALKKAKVNKIFEKASKLKK